jgi:outer membrane protein assembly factor BamE (lipoprotein component of BamABCDE complex)
MRRAWNRILLAAVIVSITFLYPLLAPTPHRIDQAHADLIVQGMTKEQVEAIFGVPAGQYDWAEEDRDVVLMKYRKMISVYYTQVARRTIDQDGVPTQIVGALHRAKPHWPQTSMTWTSRHGSFTIWFDEGERVASTSALRQVHIALPWQRWWTRVWKK